ncbi:MAG: response regulator transcription factor [Jiangellaceae bacterium]
MARVLLVEDDEAISVPLARAMRREGHDVEVAATGERALTQVRDGRYELVVLDLGLPDMDGVDVCRRLRRDAQPIPVLVLTARVQEVDAVVSLDAGADDYVTKPFRLAELMARIRAVLRRGHHATVETAPDVVVSDLRIDPRARQVWLGAEEMSLSAKEFDLLHLLVREAGHVVTREQIMREVWDVNWWSSTKTLDMHVSWLRRKLGDDPAHPRFVTTVRGVGFRFEPG